MVKVHPKEETLVLSMHFVCSSLSMNNLSYLSNNLLSCLESKVCVNLFVADKTRIVVGLFESKGSCTISPDY